MKPQPFFPLFSKTRFPMKKRDLVAQQMLSKYAQRRPELDEGLETTPKIPKKQPRSETTHEGRKIPVPRQSRAVKVREEVKKQQVFSLCDALSEVLAYNGRVSYYEDNGVLVVPVLCDEELANKLFIKDITSSILTDFKLLSLTYSEDAFILKSAAVLPLSEAIKSLLEYISLHEEPPEPPRRPSGRLSYVAFSKKTVFKGGKECIFCRNSFHRGERIMRTPCEHIFHEFCLVPWLAISATCPVDKVLLSTQ